MKKIRKKRISPLFLLSTLLLVFLLSISIGFAAMSTTLTITGSAKFEPVKMLSITLFEKDEFICASDNSFNYKDDTISAHMSFLGSNCSASYNIKISNLGQTTMELNKIEDLIFSNSNMNYIISGINIHDVIEPHEVKNVKITFKYKDDVITDEKESLNVKLRFVFNEYVPVTTYAYLSSYDGDVSFFGFTKNAITQVSRNTTLTKDEVLSKPGVVKVSNESNDEYNSIYDIYAYVENNNFYLWSQADIIYMHPKTRNAFKKFDKLTMIDFTGIDTSKIENLSHFFDTDRQLKTIIGSIDTSGLVLEYNDSFNYGNDKNNDSSGKTGLAYMFNDCNNLETVDLSKFKTTNAGDMKRMFGGCRKISGLDFSTFDTSNVKSMYWMFRQNYVNTNIDISSFDTSKVENMFGMFVQATNVETITLGDNFKTANVKNFGNMFYDIKKLKTIYATRDFECSSNSNQSNMFYNLTQLVGARGTSYETKYSSSYRTGIYAKVASESQKGYFTLK